jgi:hypothetical protein
MKIHFITNITVIFSGPYMLNSRLTATPTLPKID